MGKPKKPSQGFSGTSINADDSNVFNYTGGVATLSQILNGDEGQQIVINGGGSGALTVSDVAGNIEVAGDAILANDADNITLKLTGGVWVEVSRNIS